MIGLFRLIGKIIKDVLGILFTVALIGVCVFIDARYIEPRLLTTNTEEIHTDKLPLNKPLRVVQFSDVHLGADYGEGDFKKVIQKVNELSPDLIIFTGDLIDNNKTFKEEKEATYLLSQLQSTYGKYAVYGNHDHGGNGTKRYARMMKASGFKLLRNETSVLKLKDGGKICLIGVDDVMLGKPDYQTVFQGVGNDSFNLFISHEPDIVSNIIGKPIDLQLSGHSHGGQVRLPIIGAPFTVAYGKQYIKGLYTIEENNHMLLYVSSGIGTSQLPYRFMNIPEVTLLLIENE